MALLTDRLVATFALMTALPLARPETRLLAATPALFPLVGLALGLALAVLDLGLSQFLPRLPSSAIVVLALAVMTGALHLDGLADAADGLFGGRDPESRLRIMNDPHNGAFGAIAVALVLMLQFAAIASLEGWLRSGSLILFPMVSRTSLLWVMRFPRARPHGMGQSTAAPSLPAGVGLTVVAAAGSSVVFFPAGGLLVAVAVGIALAVGLYARRRIGGVTGDIFGAAIEVSQAAVLLAAASSVETDWLA